VPPLRRYLKVSFGTESQCIIRYLRRLPEFVDLRQDANVRALLADISRERFFARSAHGRVCQVVEKSERVISQPLIGI
jgi:hypothetical protein